MAVKIAGNITEPKIFHRQNVLKIFKKLAPCVNCWQGHGDFCWDAKKNRGGPIFPVSDASKVLGAKVEHQKL